MHRHEGRPAEAPATAPDNGYDDYHSNVDDTPEAPATADRTDGGPS